MSSLVKAEGELGGELYELQNANLLGAFQGKGSRAAGGQGAQRWSTAPATARTTARGRGRAPEGGRKKLKKAGVTAVKESRAKICHGSCHAVRW